MKKKEFPILEFDPGKKAVIEPKKAIKCHEEPPKHCLLCFFCDVIDDMVSKGQLKEIGFNYTAMGRHPLYELQAFGARLGVFHPGIGAPLCIGLMEELITEGFEKFIACGGAGVLNKEMPFGHVFVPLSAVRDEGTSYHYLEPSREVEADLDVVLKIRAALDHHNIPYATGKTWTTDAFYRETKNKVELRKQEGCLTVEMECSAFIALAKFRNVKFGQILYCGDDVSGCDWDPRHCNDRASVHEKLFWLAAEACLSL